MCNFIAYLLIQFVHIFSKTLIIDVLTLRLLSITVSLTFHSAAPGLRNKASYRTVNREPRAPMTTKQPNNWHFVLVLSIGVRPSTALKFQIPSKYIFHCFIYLQQTEHWRPPENIVVQVWYLCSHRRGIRKWLYPSHLVSMKVWNHNNDTMASWRSHYIYSILALSSLGNFCFT